MFNKILASLLMFILAGCTIYPVKHETDVINTTQLCLGSSKLPDNISNQFEAVEDLQLLNKSLGSPGQGNLCMGQVYKSKKNVQLTLYRAWNSTNPGSQFGKWWAFQKPTGEVARYRSEYEICYQWSPLDKLVRCTLKPGTKVVIGTGQSAKCSDYLTYPISDKEQVYIDDASQSLTDCTAFNGEFSWK
jgi:hypothetical protein